MEYSIYKEKLLSFLYHSDYQYHISLYDNRKFVKNSLSTIYLCDLPKEIMIYKKELAAQLAQKQTEQLKDLKSLLNNKHVNPGYNKIFNYIDETKGNIKKIQSKIKLAKEFIDGNIPMKGDWNFLNDVIKNGPISIDEISEAISDISAFNVNEYKELQNQSKNSEEFKNIDTEQPGAKPPTSNVVDSPTCDKSFEAASSAGKLMFIFLFFCVVCLIWMI